MRKILFFMIAALFVNAACADPVPPRVMRSLKGHHIMRASLQKGVLKLTTTHAVITHDIYEKIITEGTCAVLINEPEKGWAKARIDRIEVLSQDERQGYAFVDARNTCLELGKIKDENQRKAFFTKQTWICTMEICDDPKPVPSAKDKK